MAKICCSESFLSVASKDLLKVFSLEKGQCLYTYTHEFDNSVTDGNNKPLDDRLEDLCCTSDGKYICAMYSDKRIVVLDPTEWESAKEIKVKRRPTAMCFDHSGNVLFIADKSGDLYKYDLQTEHKGMDFETKEIEPILGHVSMLLDVKVSCDGKYIISADRDEKIRVSEVKNPYIIEEFCLGHAEFVCKVEPVPHASRTLFISSSGDRSVRLWDAVAGKELCKHVFEDQSVSNQGNENASSQFQYVPSIITISADGGYFTVASSQTNMKNLSVFKLDAKKCCFIYLCDLQIPNCISVQDLKFGNDKTCVILYALIISESEDCLSLHTFTYESERFQSKRLEPVNCISSQLNAINHERKDLYVSLFKARCEGEVYESYQLKKKERLKLRNKTKDSTELNGSKRVKMA
ncbi:tRNA (guanine-N(7)-)-methyltransferase non-catalytic subunit wdr4-like isoform X1 [Styela clava]